jgi:hypothetical protein
MLVALLPVLLLVPLAGTAQTWRGELQRGGEVVVDPETHRAVREEGGRTRQLWDGVHQLQDGSTVIVRDGVAIPTTEMYDAWAGGAAPEPVYRDRWCKQLVRKTCGFDDACATAPACLQARTLYADAERERREQAMVRGRDTDDAAPVPTAERCRRALAETAFPACRTLTEQGDSRCRALVTRVCGASHACAGSEPCAAARQLQGLETEERLALEDPDGATEMGRKCREAMQNPFFKPCDER